MDNLFQLLIFLFVIYTIINSIFGKKKPQRKDSEIPQGKTGEVESDTSPQPQYSSGEILQDLFGIKIPKSGGEYETYSQNRFPSNMNNDLQSTIDQSDVEKSNIPDIDYDNLPSLEFQKNVNASADMHVAYEVKNIFNQRTAELNQKLKDRNTLKELFLISEILNKPKALRK